jgi:hypothetical protein
VPDEPPWTGYFMKKKSVANKKRRPTTVGSGRLVRRKALIHGIADCLQCDWKCGDYLTVQRLAAQHHRKTGHRVSMELGYHVEFTPNEQAETSARSKGIIYKS